MSGIGVCLGILTGAGIVWMIAMVCALDNLIEVLRDIREEMKRK